MCGNDLKQVSIDNKTTTDDNNSSSGGGDGGGAGDDDDEFPFLRQFSLCIEYIFSALCQKVLKLHSFKRQ